jgi:hypothetical protein
VERPGQRLCTEDDVPTEGVERETYQRRAITTCSHCAPYIDFCTLARSRCHLHKKQPEREDRIPLLDA